MSKGGYLQDADHMTAGKVERQFHCCSHDGSLGFPSQHGIGELPVSIEQAVAALEHLDAESQRLRNQRAEIDNQLAENEGETSQLRTYLVVERKFVEARSKQETDGPASTTASTSDTSNDKTLSRRVTDMAVDLIRAKGRPIHTRPTSSDDTTRFNRGRAKSCCEPVWLPVPRQEAFGEQSQPWLEFGGVGWRYTAYHLMICPRRQM